MSDFTKFVTDAPWASTAAWSSSTTTPMEDIEANKRIIEEQHDKQPERFKTFVVAVNHIQATHWLERRTVAETKYFGDTRYITPDNDVSLFRFGRPSHLVFLPGAREAVMKNHFFGLVLETEQTLEVADVGYIEQLLHVLAGDSNPFTYTDRTPNPQIWSRTNKHTMLVSENAYENTDRFRGLKVLHFDRERRCYVLEIQESMSQLLEAVGYYEFFGLPWNDYERRGTEVSDMPIVRLGDSVLLTSSL